MEKKHVLHELKQGQQRQTETRLCTEVLQHLNSLVNVGLSSIAPLCQHLLTLARLSIGKNHSDVGLINNPRALDNYMHAASFLHLHQ